MLEGAIRLAVQSGLDAVNTASLLAAILDDNEGEAAEFLRRASIDTTPIRKALPRPQSGEVENETAPSVSWDKRAREVLTRAKELALTYSRFEPVGSREILIALLEEPGDLATLFFRETDAIKALVENYHQQRQPLKITLDPELEWRAFGPPEAVDIARIIDVNLNRAREGLRVVEEYTRFVLDDAPLSARLKQARHRLRELAAYFPQGWLHSARDTEHDVGTSLSSPSEIERQDIAAVVSANIKRCQEALRSIEEYAKIESEPAAKLAKGLRYELYTVEQVLRLNDDAATGLGDAVLYWLCDPNACRYEFEWTVHEVIAGGVGVIQLRDKTSTDRDRLTHARQLRRWTRESGVLFIMNDRPDLARLSEADGVHVGQEELSVREVRRIVGPRRLVGVSTHSIDQARQAVVDGADYLGVGPLFPSETKSFSRHVGLELVTQVSSEIGTPAFMIGGIDLARLPSVREAGGKRIAVSQAISQAEEPRALTEEFVRTLKG